MTLRLGPVAAVLVVSSLLAACTSGAGGEPPDHGDQALFDVEPDASLRLTMRDLRFEPGVVEVTAGELIAVEIENAGSLPHDFTLERVPDGYAYRVEGSELSHASSHALHLPLRAKQRGDLRLRIDEPGDYVFFCNVSGHRRAGMTGTITVR